MPGDLEITRDIPRRRPRRRRSRWTLALGITRWASPTPGISARQVALLVVLGDIGFFLLLWALIRGG